MVDGGGWEKAARGNLRDGIKSKTEGGTHPSFTLVASGESIFAAHRGDVQGRVPRSRALALWVALRGVWGKQWIIPGVCYLRCNKTIDRLT